MQADECPHATKQAAAADFDFFNSPAEYRRAAAEHARDGAFYSGSGDGFWVFTEYGKICDAFRDEEQFTVERVSAAEGADDERWVPLTIDGGEHAQWRRKLGAWFTPQRVRELQPTIRANAQRRIEALIGRGSASFNEDFARPYVLENLMVAVGWPVDDLDHLLRINLGMIASRYEPDPREAAFHSEVGLPGLDAYVRKNVELRRAEPADDLVTATFDWEIDGVPITDEDRISLLSVLFLAGVDSTVNHMSNAVQHLAHHDEDRARFVADREVRPAAVEEFLRVFSCMYPGRKAARDGAGSVAGHGQTVLLPLALANHDPEVFPDPERVRFEREKNPHIAFGTGHHQCAGAGFARAQLHTALDEWHERIPQYRLPPSADEVPPFLRNAYDLRLVW
ncbi:cytochrome P450 [Saccharopolyspora sp. NFXS83]|uniref:cytochrome P450 n=1 Tax=Saccharopolyspora sp. NFXS83 TaxID=2993560 RepID=UPI00224B55A0|nr:cytochrome P450 [Saccharopolyspora sp. NFXS83]MCX2729182.1 cytochrome P450 [Saccharopolyspora sp. NFXS83]